VSSSRQGTDIAEDIDVLVGALKDCALDLYSCLLLPLVRDPKDPYLLAALGTTIFSGNLIAQTAIRKSQPNVVVEDPGRREYLPILLDDPTLDQAGLSESGDISDEVSILISSPPAAAAAAGRAEARGELTFSGDTSRPTDISAVGHKSASDIGLKQRRRTFGGKQKSQGAGGEPNKKGGGGGRRKSGVGRQKAGRGRNRKSERKTDEEEAENKLKKEKRRGSRKSYSVESRKGLLASGGLTKPGNGISSTDALVSSVGNSKPGNAIGNSSKESKDWDKVDRDQFRDLNNVTIEGDAQGQRLKDFPGCGSTQQTDSPNQHPWLGALYSVPLPAYSENETDRFVVPVALLSAKTKLRPNWPTIIVATGDIFDPKLMNSSSASVSSEDLAAWGMKMEVRFALESPSGPVVLPVKSITWHPGFAGQDGQKEDPFTDLAAIEVDSANLWHSSGQDVYPLCLTGASDQYTAVTLVGWDIESSTLRKKLLSGKSTPNDLGPPITLPVELEECGELAAGGEHADTSLCFTSEAPRSPGWGSLILSSDESTNRVSLVGFSRRKSPHLPRQGEGRVSRISCLLHWLAKLYGLTWPHSDICDYSNQEK